MVKVRLGSAPWQCALAVRLGSAPLPRRAPGGSASGARASRPQPTPPILLLIPSLLTIQAQLEGELIRDLPLWRVQWPASPGCSQVYNVHVPHYTHMFTTLDAASTALGVPGLFGHLLLPGGSANLGDPAYALVAGSEAPLIGVVMQVIEVAPLADGRLQVTAAGLCRFEVVRATQTTPYSRADVRPLPDDDEVAAYSGRASRMLARVTAAAKGLEWASQEVSAGIGAVVAEGMEGEVLPLPTFVTTFHADAAAAATARGAAAAIAFGTGPAEAVAADADAASDAVNEAANQAASDLFAAEERRAAELVSAAELFEDLLGELPDEVREVREGEVTDSEADAEHEAGAAEGAAEGAAADASDITAEISEIDDDDALASPAALARAQAARAERLAASVDALRGGALLALEQQLWCELIRCLSLTRALRSPYAAAATADAAAAAATVPVSLPQALSQLMPPPPTDGWPVGAPAARPAAEQEWMARYPPYRRAQRLSYAVAALTPEVDRQKLLLAPSTMSRLMIMSEFFCEARKRLEVAMALRVAGMDGGQDLS